MEPGRDHGLRIRGPSAAGDSLACKVIARDYARTDQSDAAGGNRGIVVGTDDVCHTHIEDLLATTWSLVCEIRTPTQACQDRPHQEGHPGRWIPAVLAHHRAGAAMLALSVEGFLPMPYTVWGHARLGEGGLRCSSAMFLMRRADG